MEGQQLEILNSDPVNHNVHAESQVNPPWNESQPPRAEHKFKRFDSAEVLFPVTCSVHPWMRSYIGVSPHPFFAVTGDDGSFTLKGVPPGTYTIEAVHEKYGRKEGKLTLAPSGDRDARFHLWQSSIYNPGLHRWSILLAFCTLLLVVAGGLVTSRDAGLSVPDWPLSYGKLMPPMEGGILYEHGHRMVATTVGLADDRLDDLAVPVRTPEVDALARRDRAGGRDRAGRAGRADGPVCCCPGGSRRRMPVWRSSSSRRPWRWRCLRPTGGCAVRRLSEKLRSYPIRDLSLAAPLCVLAQLALGAAARHKAIGSIYHIAAVADRDRRDTLDFIANSASLR